jgi:hypothetical protein
VAEAGGPAVNPAVLGETRWGVKMAAQRPIAASNARAALASAVGFACFGGFFVLLGAASILTATPSQAHDLLPLSGIGDVPRRFGEVAPLLSATIAALVTGVVAMLVAARRLDALAAAIELLILGVVIEGCVLGAIGRIGHATDGSVLGAAVVCVMGGAAVLASGIVALLARE